MKELTLEGTKKIYIFEKLLPEDICLNWIEKCIDIDETRGKNESFSEEIFTTIQSRLGEFPVPIQGYRPEVTIGKRKIGLGEHYDQVLGKEKWKLFCYLNDVKGGGTDFRDGAKWISIEPSMGTVVLFDMKLFHRGSLQQEPTVKYTVGIRLE